MSGARNAAVFRRQVIDANGPGTVLHDFESLLEFVGAEGVSAAGKYHLLPMERLPELDEKMAWPLRPRLQRPQQKSYPHINGLYLLLRATQLGVAKGMGKKTGRLVLDPAMLEQWRTLNPTERYFDLLEAWLLHGRSGMLGEAGGGRGYAEMVLLAKQVWGVIGMVESASAGTPGSFEGMIYGLDSFATLALMELFGLAEVSRGEPAEGKSWRVLEVRRTKFGAALMEEIFKWWLSNLGPEDDPPDFGAWQPLFQRYFPDWRNNLTMPEPEFRDGVYYLKARCGDVWRRIAISADSDLEDLATTIIRAFRFEGDHLYGFRFTERDGAQVRVEHPYVKDAWMHTNEFSIGYLPLAEGQSMLFLYDYGASWHFDVKLEKIEPPNPRMKRARVVESHGTAPREYDDEY
jgi:hypothetical protein